MLYYNTFFEKFKGFYKTFIIKVIFRFSATFFTSPSPSLPQPPSPENMSPISPPSYSLSSPSHSPHTGKIQFHVLFLCIKSAPFFLLSALKNLRKPDAVSYTHLDVYKRQDRSFLISESVRGEGGRVDLHVIRVLQFNIRCV